MVSHLGGLICFQLIYSYGQAEEVSKDLECTSSTLGFFFYNLTLAVRGNICIPSVLSISLELPVRGRKYRSISGLCFMVEKALLRFSGFVVKVL